MQKDDLAFLLIPILDTLYDYHNNHTKVIQLILSMFRSLDIYRGFRYSNFFILRVKVKEEWKANQTTALQSLETSVNLHQPIQCSIPEEFSTCRGDRPCKLWTSNFSTSDELWRSCYLPRTAILVSRFLYWQTAKPLAPSSGPNSKQRRRQRIYSLLQDTMLTISLWTTMHEH